MRTECHLLFVYGTLLRSIESQIARYLNKHSIFVGKGKMSGYLYDLGQYPAAVYDPNSEHIVHGHIFDLITPLATLDILDQYEGIGITEEYARQQVVVEAEEKKLQCWAYLYQLPTSNLQRIESGNYLSYLSHPNSKHWSFIRSV